MTNIRQALEQGTLTLTQAGQPHARLDAQVLLSHVLNVERSMLYAYPERTLTAEEEQQYLTLIERRTHGEPVAYLTGHKEFYALALLLAKRLFIPLPLPELLVH